MKKFLPLLATCLMFSGAPAHAIVGGPWDGNNFNQNNAGTYQASISMRNGLGMARFTDQGDVAQFAVVNQSVIFYQGAVYLGGCFGNVDFVNGEVTGITNGSTINAFINSSQGGNVQTCNTSWRCDITEQAPIMRFSGSGQANFFGALTAFENSNATTTTTTTTTTVVDADADTGITTETVTEVLTEAVERVADVGGQNSEFESLGASTRIYVYGAQISTEAITALQPASGGGAGGVGGTAAPPVAPPTTTIILL